MRHGKFFATSFLLLLATLSCLRPTAFAAGITVSPLPHPSDIPVYEIVGDYDAENVDGTFNASARQEVTRAFFRTHPDAFDFLVIFSNFDFQMPENEAIALYHGVKNDVQGIGKELVDNSELYGSQGTLQGIIDMGNINAMVSNPLDPGYSDTMGTLSHELLHRWAAEVRFRRDDNSISDALLGRGGTHWSFLLDTAGSLEYGNRWLDNGNSTFTALAGRRYFSPLDLYLMGLLEKSAVPPMLLIDNPEIDPARLPEPGVTITGAAQSVTIDQIVAAEGERIPAAADSQKNFRIGCLLITRPGTYTAADLPRIRNIMESWPLWFSGLTGGRGTIAIDATPLPDLPDNPGPPLPPIDPRTAPPEINDGVAWLLAHQLPDGSWQDNAGTADRDTTTALATLADFTTTGDATARGVAWLETTNSANLDYLARKIKLLTSSSHDALELVEYLLARQNGDGGWGSNPAYGSSAADTALALQALRAAGGPVESTIAAAVGHLRDNQLADGGWGVDGHSNLQTTVEVLTALTPYRASHELNVCVANGLTWLTGAQQADGGFGDDGGSVYQTAQALIFLKELGVDSPAIDQALAYLLSRQAADGSWFASAFQTSLAVRAIRIAMQTPDLSVSTEDLVPKPATITILPTELRLTVTVRNSGLTEVPAAKVVLYEGAVDAGHRVGETILSLAGQSSTTHVFTTAITGTNPHHFFVVVDPDNQVHESSEQNNSALRIVYPAATYDFAVDPYSITVTPSTGNIFEPLAVFTRIRNNGTVDAFNVPIQLSADNGSGPITVAIQSIDLPAGQHIDTSFSWVPMISGAGISLSVIVDPHHTFAETAEDNNRALVTIDIHASTMPDLLLSSADISFDPAPALEAGSTLLRASVLNRGFSTTTDVLVDFFDGWPEQSGTIHLGSAIIPVIEPGIHENAQIEWGNIPLSGERKITAVIDRQNLIAEIDEKNNRATASLRVLALPDFEVTSSSISFSPETPREGDPVTVSALIRNRGEQPASSVPVVFNEKNTPIGTILIPHLEANGLATVSVTLDTNGKMGVTEVEVIVDPENTISEQDKTNNRAARKLGVQNVDLWLSNKYISPNGDGIKDSTDFGYRLTAPQSVTVVLADEEGEIVREYSGPDFADTSYVTLTWDGLDRRGRVVDDGQYQIQVLSESGTILASLLVTVDTNRSPLTQAIGTEYLLENNISCELPAIGRADWTGNRFLWEWFPDESGIIFQVTDYYSKDFPEYPPGLYTMGPDGSDIYSLLPATWQDNDLYTYSYTFGPELALSPDGYKVAFIRDAYTPQKRKWETTELWTIDRRDGTLILLDSYNLIESDTWFPGTWAYELGPGSWSPDGTKFIYFTWKDRTRNENGTLYIINADGSERIEIATGPIPYWTEFKWSPDGNHFTYITYDDEGAIELGIVRVADGAKVARAVVGDFQFGTFVNWVPDSSGVIYLTEGGYAGVDDAHSVLVSLSLTGETRLLWQSEDWLWFDNLGQPDKPPFSLIDPDLVVISAYDFDAEEQTIYLVERHGIAEKNRQYTQGKEIFFPSSYPGYDYGVFCEDHALSPVTGLVAYANCADNKSSVRICDTRGLCRDFDLGQPQPATAGWGAPYELRWSDDGRRLAYIIPIPILTEGGWYTSRQELVVIDIDRGETKFIDLAPIENSLQWLGDNVSLMGSDDLGTFVVDSKSGTYKYLLIAAIDYNYDEIRFSPLGYYIAVNSSRNPGTECATDDNIWTLSSLLNLSAVLQASKDGAAVTLKGIASDLNFASWQLEYAERRSPDAWHLISPSSEIPVVNGPMATWVPPHEGSFWARLTIKDKAGNSTWVRTAVNWGKKFSISNLYKTGELFSPNGDGVLDSVGLNYTANEPVHLELTVHDADGNLVRTFRQNHTLPGEYGIIWDGRDETGGIVPDGYYSIRIFDYEFFFQVDSRPPDLRLQFSPIACDKPPVLQTDLNGYAHDLHLKSWVVLYGIGDHPVEWREFKRGETIPPDLIQSFTAEASPSFALLDNTTFKIVAEDFAGNESVRMTRFPEELFVLSRWDNAQIPIKKNKKGLCGSPDLLPFDYLAPGRHTLTMVETLRNPLQSATVQYREHMRWLDAGRTIDPPGGGADLIFDTSSLPPEEIAAVRIKAIDEGGIEYVSNTLVFNPPVFKAQMECSDEGSPSPPLIKMAVSLAEDLDILKLQATTTIAGIDQWMDLSDYSPAVGDPYQFVAPKPGHMAAGSRYPLRIVGIGESGQVYISNELTSPPQPCESPPPPPPPPPSSEDDTTLDVSYSHDKAPCNTVKTTPVTIAVRYDPFDGPKPLPDGVRYYLKENGSWRFLKQFAPAVEGWGSVSIDTSSLSEGEHPVKVDLVYGESVWEAFKTNALRVDRTLPEARITSPAPSVPFCAKRIVDDKGQVFRYAEIEGVVADLNDISGYSLVYNDERNPRLWFDMKEGALCHPEAGDCPYAGTDTTRGQLGSWNVTNLDSGEHTVQLMVTDRFGNTSCVATPTRIDMELYLTSTVSAPLFSPNGDGVQDQVAIGYQAGELAVLDITVLHDGIVVRRLVTGRHITDSLGTVIWDGRDDSGSIVPDGIYQIESKASDLCGNTEQKTLFVTVDNTPPTAMILHPGSDTPPSIVTEVTGTVNDPHLLRYQLHVRDEGSVNPPVLVGRGTVFVDNGILGIWNTHGLTGNWSLILSAEDRAGNTRTTSLPVIFGTRPQLISSLQTEPRIFSPNADGLFDTTTITYVLTETANLIIGVKDAAGSTVLSKQHEGRSAGSHQLQWTGLGPDGSAHADGVYLVHLIADAVTQPPAVQEEQITLIIDTDPPAIDLTAPLDASAHAGLVTVQGTLRDPNLHDYAVTLSGGQEPRSINTSVVNGEIAYSESLDLEEGNYDLRVDARDSAGNADSKTVSFTVDKTPPRITLTSPATEEFFGGAKPEVVIRGLIEEANLQSYRVRYGAGAEPTDWLELAGNTTLPPDNLLATWRVGPEQNLADGDYTIRVTAVDKAGLESSAEVAVRIDNHPPELALVQPGGDSLLTKPFAVIGSVGDRFLKEYTLQLAGTACAGASNWSLLRHGHEPAANATLATLSTLPEDGVYCLRLTAEDLHGNTAQRQVDFTIDTTPPAPPLLIGRLDSSAAVALQWSGNSEPDLAGFNLYRNSVRLNDAPLTTTQFLDQGLDSGTYAYTVRAVDLAGLESRDSNRQAFTIDLTPPEAMITSPKAGDSVGNFLDIIGRAYSPDDFKEYRVFSGSGNNPQSWQMLRKSPVPIPHGTLVRWDAYSLPDGPYTLRLEAEDLSGNVNVKTVTVTVDNTPPAAPVLLTATPDGSTIALAWQANVEPDLAGYLVFRDGRLANESGTVLGDLTPYVITALEFQDNGVPDGTHNYYLVAMDTAGNLSDQSNSLQVDLDTHAPHLRIVTPAPGLVFDKPIPVRAESEDTDIAAVRFQYRQSSTTPWSDLGAALAQRPYVVTLDPAALGWENGLYRLRAVATDLGGLTDMTPEEVDIHFKDVTSPAPPMGAAARVNSGFVTLSWTPSQAPDLAGYNVYLGATNVKRNASLLTEATYLDPAGSSTGLLDGVYEYKITAVDTSGNESNNTPVSATVFTPLLNQPPSPAHDAAVTVDGKTLPGAMVEIFRSLPAGSESLGTSQANGQGVFAQTITLNEAANNLYAVATDAEGNTSRPSPVISIFYDPPPAAPLGLAATVDKADVALSWAANSETDLAGYNIYRWTATSNWRQINAAPVAATIYTDTGLRNDTYRYRITALDQSGGESSPSAEVTAVIEQQPPMPPTNLTAATVPEGKAIDLCWQASPDPVAAYLLYRGLVTGGPYRSVAGGPTTDTCSRDGGLTNGTRYFYIVRAIDSHGNESTNSNEASALAQDTASPEKPLLLLPTVSGRPYQSPAGQVDIFGYTEAGAMVDLLHDQEWIYTVLAQAEPIHTVTSLESGSIKETAATPDGKYLYFSKWDSSSYPYVSRVFRRDLASGDEVPIERIPVDSQFLRISPFGDKMAYVYPEGDRSRIGIYDLAGNTASPLTSTVGVDEREPAWSRDGLRLVHTANPGTGPHDIWLHDLTTDQSTRITENVDGLYPELSPDGQQVAFLVRDSSTWQLNLQLVPVQGGALRRVATDIDWPSGAQPAVEWSPVANLIAFTSSVDGMDDIALYDAETGTTERLTTTGPVECTPLWSPDGKQISYATTTDAAQEIRMISTNDPDEDQLLHTFAWSWVSDYAWLPSGIFYSVGSDLHRLTPPGTFVYEDVALHPGQNSFSARAEDEAGNASDPADEILVQVATEAMPDLEILDSDIFIFPEAPLSGDQVTLGAVAHNRSAVAAENVRAEIYLWDATGTVRLLHAATIPVLGPGAEEWFSVNWDSSSMAGPNTLYVLLDPDNTIGEAREDNNRATREFHVAGEEGITFATSLNGSTFASDEMVAIEVALHNSGPARDVHLTVAVEDASGVPVTELTDQDRHLPYGGNERVPLTWSAGSVLAGSYRVRTVLTEPGGALLGEESKPFTILPDMNVSAALSTDKARYGSGDNVALALAVTNQGTNYFIPELRARLAVADQNQILHTEEQTLTDLAPGDSASLNARWNTARHAPGAYTATAALFIGEEQVATAGTSFAIDPVLTTTGIVAATPKTLFRDSPVEVGFRLTASGNVEAGAVPIRLLVIDPRTRTTVASHGETVLLAANTEIAGQHRFAPLPWDIGVYRVELRRVRQDGDELLASDSFTVRDGVAPTLTVLSPAAGSILNGPVDLTVTAVDDGSGVASVEYQRDNGPWLPLPLVQPATGRYASRWLPVEAEEGPHTLRFRATDLAGNVSHPVASAIELRPHVSLTAATDKGAYGMNETVAVTTTLANTGWEKHLHLALRVETRAGDLVAALADQDLTLTADGRQTLHHSWNTGNVAAGDYKVRVSVSKNGTLLAENLVPFAISQVRALVGTLTLDVDRVPLGDPVNAHWSLTNTGNCPLAGLGVEHLLSDQNGAPIRTWNETLTLDQGQTAAGSLQIETLDLAPGAYQLTLKGRAGGEELSLTTVSFTLLDTTPPQVLITTPVAGALVTGEIEIVALVTDEATGVATVEYRIDQQPWLLLPRLDPAGATYVARWIPTVADGGDRTISVRARDNADNLSEPVTVSIRVELCDPSATLAGSLDIAPEVVTAGEDITLAYTLRNDCTKPLTGLQVRIVVLDPTTGAPVQEFHATTDLAAAGSGTGSFTLASESLSSKEYPVRLEASLADTPARTLAESSFTVLAATEGGNTELNQANYLVWLNEGHEDCEDDDRHGEDDEEDEDNHPQNSCGRHCAASARIAAILEQAADSFRIVCDREEFEEELRNPFHTDIVIIGDRQPLTDHHKTELRERVFAGAGLLAFAWNEPGESYGQGDSKQSLLGIKARGTLPGDEFAITLAASPIAPAGTLPVPGPLARVEAAPDTEVAGWAQAAHGGHQLDWHGDNQLVTTAATRTSNCPKDRPDRFPALVLHEFGLGRTVYAAFDLCAAFTAANDAQLSTLLRGALAHVHRPDPATELIPYLLHPFALQAPLPAGAADLRARITCPADLRLFDPTAAVWINTYPWDTVFPLRTEAAAILPYALLPPDRTGTFACEFSTGRTENGQFIPLQRFTDQFVVAQDRNGRLQEAIQAVGSLAVSRKEQTSRSRARQYLQNVLLRTGSGRHQAEQNIHDLEKAVTALLQIETVPITEIRLKVDTLLRMEQARWYLSP